MKKTRTPRPIDLNLRILVDHPYQDEEGMFTFMVAHPTMGMPSFRIKAKTAKDAKVTLESYIYNSLDGREDIRSDD